MTPIIFLRATFRARDPFSVFLSIKPEDTQIHTSVIHERHHPQPLMLHDLLDDQASEEFVARHSKTLTVLVRRAGEIVATGIFEVYYRDGDLDLRPCVTVNLSLSQPDASVKSPLSDPLRGYAGNLDASKGIVDDLLVSLQDLQKSNRSAEKEEVEA